MKKNKHTHVGYVGIFKEDGNTVPHDQAFDYAMERCGLKVDHPTEILPEFRNMLCEWFYSGNWLRRGE